MLQKLYNSLAKPLVKDLELLKLQSIISMNLSRAAATAAVRQLDFTNPLSWEFSGFSQNGEDGIIDVLVSKLTSSNKYFIEIGASNGLENNTAWLAHAKKFKGLMIEGDPKLVKQGNLVKSWLVHIEQMFVTLDTLGTIEKLALYKNPDLMSIDIDGNDYYIASKLIESGFRPKIMVVEYNSAYGPQKSCTIKYDPGFNAYASNREHLYYGVSISAWKKLFESRGYKFVTVDSNGVNAFFADPQFFEPSFLQGLKGSSFRENTHQERKFKADWTKQFEYIKDAELVEVS